MESGTENRFGKYTLLERITTGGMAEVFRAVSRGPRGFSRIMAIKKILPQYADSREFQRMFVDEATIAARLNHANIAQVYDFDIHDGTPYIAMEFVEGKDLRAILRTCHENGTPIPYPFAVFLAMEAAKGLFYVHSRRESSRPLNIIHRDVSPQNLMLSYAGEVKLVDFGIAHAVQRETETVAGTIKGKYAYMSPEQISGEKIDHRTDIFSLGIVLWEMLTLERLFAAPTQAQTINNVLRKSVPEPHQLRPEIPAALSPLVMCALQRNPSHRYPTMLAFHEALSRFLFDTGSYPELEQVTSFLHSLFPEDIERLRQGEHLSFPDTDPQLESDDISPLEPTRPNRTAHPNQKAEEPTATATTEPAAAYVRKAAPKRTANPTVSLLLLMVVLGLLGIFGWQFYQRVFDNAPEAQPAPMANSHEPDLWPAPPPQRDLHSAPDVAQHPPDDQSQPTSLDASPNERAEPDTDVHAMSPSTDIRSDASAAKPVSLQMEQVTFSLYTKPPDALIVIAQNTFTPGTITLETTPGQTVQARISRAGYATIEDRFLPLNGLEKTYELLGQAHLEVWVEPKDAIVEIDGKELTRSGKDGLYVKEVGLNQTVHLYVHRADYHSKTRAILIDDKKVKSLITLKAKTNAAAQVARPSYGKVKVAAKPYAQAYFGPQKEDWGQISAPQKHTVPVGDHTIHLYYAGTDTWAVCNVTVTEGHTVACYHDFLTQE